MNSDSGLLESKALQAYAKRIQEDVARIVGLTRSFAAKFEISDPELKRSLHLEACAFACHWIESFTAASPEMASWAQLFSGSIRRESDAARAYQAVGHPKEAARFFVNRSEFYRFNQVSWKLNEQMLTAWNGVVNFTVLCHDLKAPAFIAENQEARWMAEIKGEDAQVLEKFMGVDPGSQEYCDELGGWLNEFISDLVRIVSDSNKASIEAIVEHKKEGVAALRVVRIFQGICLVLSLGCLAFAFSKFDQAWPLLAQRVVVSLVAVCLAVVLRGWQVLIALVLAIAYNPFVKIGFSDYGMIFVNLATAAFFAVVAFFPNPHSASRR